MSALGPFRRMSASISYPSGKYFSPKTRSSGPVSEGSTTSLAWQKTAYDGVQLVSFPGAVEVYLSIEEDEVDGQAVGIAVLAYDGKDAALRGFQDGEALLLRSGLLESSQWSEICHTCLNYRWDTSCQSQRYYFSGKGVPSRQASPIMILTGSMGLSVFREE